MPAPAGATLQATSPAADRRSKPPRRKAVFVVEYLSNSTAEKAAGEARRDGFIPNTRAHRNLHKVAE
jgi:hypothetical protein